MKALIVIDIPEIDFESCRANVEIDVGKKKIFRSRRIIRPMPTKKKPLFDPDHCDIEEEIKIVHEIVGYNRCIDEIMGETK